jgi:hypothetical protein
MVSLGKFRRVALVRTNVSEKLRASFIRVFLRSVRRLLVTGSVIPSSLILVSLMKEALSSSEMSVLTRATRRNIPEDPILHSHRREDLKSYELDIYSVLLCISQLGRVSNLTLFLAFFLRVYQYCFYLYVCRQYIVTTASP